MKSDEEINKSFSVTLDGNIIRFTILTEQKGTENISRQAQLAKKSILEYYNSDKSKSFNGLVNLLPLGNAKYLTINAKKIYASLISLPRINKMAFIVPSRFSRILMGILIQVSNKWSGSKCFIEEESAYKWLRK